MFRQIADLEPTYEKIARCFCGPVANQMANGVFGITTPEQWYRKLLDDYRIIQGDPENQNRLTDYFVTADSLVDWVGDKTIRKNHVVPRICSHIANQAKHRTVDRHHSVDSTDKDGYVAEGYIEDYYEAPVVIQLTQDEASLYGKSRVNAIEFAEDIMSFWASQFPDEEQP